MSHYQKLQAEDSALEEAINAANTAVDYHTFENRKKRKSMQECRKTLARQMKLISRNAQQASKSLLQLSSSVESNLALAKGGSRRRLRQNQERDSTRQGRLNRLPIQPVVGGADFHDIAGCFEIV
jgi:hypothetical protein